ncbi:MAG: tail fiber domain-containing protein, partial [Terriglobales bacterium]
INPDGVYHIYDITAGVKSRFVLTPSGNVGIGNDAPGQSLSVGGVIESLAGFKFPDGSMQTTAATGGGGGTITGAALALPNTSSSSVGVITLGGTPFLHNFGTNNTFVGASAGNLTMTGPGNNTAVGATALTANQTGKGQSAFGNAALAANTTGTQNSAFGSSALTANTTGNQNAAFGNSALFSNTSGNTNSAFGTSALAGNTTASLNSAFGFGALEANTGDNSSNNSAFGQGALFNLKGGANNLALGAEAGSSLTGTEHDNIYVGSIGVAGESQTIHIGTGQTATFIAGISGRTSASGVAVFINTLGQLGTITSSRLFKHEIADMGAESDLLMKLRPVAFYYKPELDETQTRQYGLVAEEVAKVAPQLVVYDENGAPQTVRYHFVNAMLLNEVQKQRRVFDEQQSTIARQQAEIQDMAARLARLEALVYRAGR